MELDISWEEKSVNQKEQPHIVGLLREGIQQALSIGNRTEDVEIGLVLVDDAAIQQLNKDYRGIDRPTDVLSFAMQEKGEGEPDLYMEGLFEDQPEEGEKHNKDQGFFVGEDVILGDIVISVERARTQALEYGHSFERELVFLAVHGTLHLLGFDHGEADETAAMRAAEEQVMEKLGLSR